MSINKAAYMLFCIIFGVHFLLEANISENNKLGEEEKFKKYPEMYTFDLECCFKEMLNQPKMTYQEVKEILREIFEKYSWPFFPSTFGGEIKIAEFNTFLCVYTQNIFNKLEQAKKLERIKIKNLFTDISKNNFSLEEFEALCLLFLRDFRVDEKLLNSFTEEELEKLRIIRRESEDIITAFARDLSFEIAMRYKSDSSIMAIFKKLKEGKKLTCDEWKLLEQVLPIFASCLPLFIAFGLFPVNFIIYSSSVISMYLGTKKVLQVDKNKWDEMKQYLKKVKNNVQDTTIKPVDFFESNFSIDSSISSSESAKDKND